jgi:hypothetical protein
MTCPVHKAVNTICFWGPRPVKSWKRPALFALSLPFVLGAIALWWYFGGRGFAAIWPIVIAVAIGGFGTVVSLFGCDECVARGFGEI